MFRRIYVNLSVKQYKSILGVVPLYFLLKQYKRVCEGKTIH